MLQQISKLTLTTLQQLILKMSVYKKKKQVCTYVKKEIKL